MKKVLIIDDDPDILKLLRVWFRDEVNVEFTYAIEYIELMAIIAQESFDLYMVDINLKFYSGFDVLKVLGKSEKLANRVIMFSASSSVEDKIKGFNAGVANFIEKPLNRELVSAVLRKNLKAQNVISEKSLNLGRVSINPSLQECTIKKEGVSEYEYIELTPIEFRFLSRLISSVNRITSKEELSFLGKDKQEPMSFKSVEMHIASLRLKLKQIPGFIKTKRGVGYYCSKN